MGGFLKTFSLEVQHVQHFKNFKFTADFQVQFCDNLNFANF